MCSRLSRVQERRARSAQAQAQVQAQTYSPRPSQIVLSQSSQGLNRAEQRGIVSRSPSHSHSHSQAHSQASHGRRAVSDGIQDEERNGIEIAAAALGQPEGVGQVPFYTGTYAFIIQMT